MSVPMRGQKRLAPVLEARPARRALVQPIRLEVMPRGLRDEPVTMMRPGVSPESAPQAYPGDCGQARERSLPCGQHEHQLVQDQEFRVHANGRATRTLRAPHRFAQAPSDAARAVGAQGLPSRRDKTCLLTIGGCHVSVALNVMGAAPNTSPSSRPIPESGRCAESHVMSRRPRGVCVPPEFRGP